jgi:hypothetical protein
VQGLELVGREIESSHGESFFSFQFGIISLPFMLLTVLSRLMSISIIVAFLDIHWTAIMFAA